MSILLFGSPQSIEQISVTIHHLDPKLVSELGVKMGYVRETRNPYVDYVKVSD